MLRFTAVALLLGVIDSYNTLSHLSPRLPELSQPRGNRYVNEENNMIQEGVDRQRKFRAERNLYLSLFTLVLLYSIRRMVNLIVDGITMEEEMQDSKQRLEKVSRSRDKGPTELKELGGEQSRKAQNYAKEDKKKV